VSKIRILQFPIRNTNSGVTHYALRNWSFIDKSHFHFDFATLDKELDFHAELIAQGCKVHYISCYAEDNIEQFTLEFNRILDNGYDVIHLHTSYWKSFTVEKLARARNVPVIIVHSHNTGLGGAPANVNQEKAMALHNEQKASFTTELATHFCACSQLAADWLFGPQIPRDRIRVMANAIDVEQFAYRPDVRMKQRHELQITEDFIIGHVGRFENQKNHSFLIDVFAEVNKQIPLVKLILVSVGTLFETIREKVADLGLSDKVLFLGKWPDVTRLYQAMDLFVLPSLYEGLAVVLLEAQASGLRCLVSETTSTEATVTANIKFLSLDKRLWINRIIDIIRSTYDRCDQSVAVTTAGYSIKEQIRSLERLYRGEDS